MTEAKFTPASVEEINRHMAAIRRISEEWARGYTEGLRKFVEAANRPTATCPSCSHGVEAHRVGDVCIIDNCNCQEKP